MSAKQKAEIIEEEITKQLGSGQRWQYHQSHLMEDWVEGSVLASKILDTGDLKVIAEHIERRAGNMVVDPVNRASIARTRVRLQVVNPHTTGWPCRDSRIAVINPDFAPLVACGCQMYGYHECFFAWNGCGPVRQTFLGG
jgi:hypothetical protein